MEDIEKGQDILTEDVFRIHRVDQGLRIVHLIVDTIVFYLLFLFLFFVFFFIYATIDDIGASILIMEIEAETGYTNLVLNLIGLLIYFIYYFVSEGLFGRTLGKLITGSVVVTSSVERPTWKAILYRSLSRLVPFEAFSFFGDIGWHDKWSNTYVVKKKDIEITN